MIKKFLMTLDNVEWGFDRVNGPRATDRLIPKQGVLPHTETKAGVNFSAGIIKT